MCDIAGAMHGFNSKAYKTCLERIDVTTYMDPLRFASDVSVWVKGT